MDPKTGELKEGFGYYKTVQHLEIQSNPENPDTVASYDADSIVLLDDDTASRYAKFLIKLDDQQNELDANGKKKTTKGSSLEDLTVNK